LDFFLSITRFSAALAEPLLPDFFGADFFAGAIFLAGAFFAAISNLQKLVGAKTITQSKSPPPFLTGGFR
jgi:hypothetical protein